MITNEEVFHIGRFVKPHGVKGEMVLALQVQAFDDDTTYPFLVVDVNGILVPFFIESFRFKGNSTGLVLLQGVDSEAQARKLAGSDVFLHRSLYQVDAEKDEYSWQIFKGFYVVDSLYGELGKIVGVDDQTPNVLFLLEAPSGERLIIPAADPLISQADEQKKVLFTNLPEGLFP